LGIIVKVVLALVLGMMVHLAASGGPAAAGERIALLIGNQNYAANVGALKNPLNDIAIMGAALGKAGFEVLPPIENATRTELLHAVRNFARRLGEAGPGAVGFFYYSGHGAAETETGPNYIIPVDVESTEDADLWDASINLNEIIRRLRNRAPQAAHFIVFDACRNELRTRAKSLSKGFVPVVARPGTFIAFSTSPNARASDAGSGAGPYARALAEEIAKGGQDHMDVFFNTKQAVASATEQVQIPWERNGLLRRIYFAGAKRAKKPRTPISEAATTWAEIKQSRQVAILETYVERFPDSIYAALAKARLAKLQAPSEPSPGAVPSQFGADRAHPFDGFWSGQLCNGKSRNLEAFCVPRMAVVRGGRLQAQWGYRGKPRSGRIEGEVSREGKVSLTITGIAGQARIRGKPYFGYLNGSASGGAIKAAGKYRPGRSVTLELTREGGPAPVVLTSSVFDGDWLIQKSYEVCSAERQGRFKVPIRNGEFASSRNDGRVRADGIFKFKHDKRDGRFAVYKGRIVSGRGDGTFEHPSRSENRTCRGRFIIERQAAAGLAIAPSGKDLALLVQAELKRAGCYPGAIDGIWGAGSRAAVKRFNTHANTALAAHTPQSDTLSVLKARPGRICPKAVKPASRTATSTSTRSAPKRCRLETKTECIRRVCPSRTCGLRGSGICKLNRRHRIC